MVLMIVTIEDEGKVIPCQWNDRDGCVAKNTKHFQGVDLQPYRASISVAGILVISWQHVGLPLRSCQDGTGIDMLVVSIHV